ncbi:MAG: hypothetical protein KBG82_03555 [Spirochaetes bacterium]|nr:hypothetical protein [Spirochaetota bacterium]HNV43131.1 hypothetical protein [Exilispira sp.]MBP8991032.1 hypothetical protein [Spirochaetota bacterium]HOV45403.1 hypothetical protein [Exilispira sp.]HPB47011.1 hypothetical protein [Exilispira sp.]
MSEKIAKLFKLIEEELELYQDLYFNEFDKGCLLFCHRLESFNERNEISRKIINALDVKIKEKRAIVDEFAKEFDDPDINIEKILKRVAEKRVEEYYRLRHNLESILKALSSLNEKNKVLLDTTYSVSKAILEGLTSSESLYTDKGSIKDNSYSTVSYNI